jgi:predicted hotdog family 3-hydroxylacyl-ACP dehydratase
MTPSRYSLAQLLPHSGHMMLLDELLSVEPEQIICGVTIRPDSLFCECANGVPAWTGIEYMAQTACCYAGLDDARAERPPSICFLLGSRRYECATPWFALGWRLRVVSALVFRDEGDLAAFDCSIYCDDGAGDRLLARGDIKAYRPHDVQMVLRGDRI